MPKKVSKGSDYVEYIYLANGEKLAKKKNGQFVNFYCGSFVYKGDKSLVYIVHGEGLAQKNGSLFDYQYNLTDHLGNVRNVLNASGTSVQSNDYYPFGLTHIAVSNLAKNKYLYNGKEAQDELIGGTIFNMSDYGARHYDRVTGRWLVIDPLAEKSRRWGTYTYCYNNPMRFIDPDGMFPGGLIRNYDPVGTVKTVEYTAKIGAFIGKEAARGFANTALTVGAVGQIITGQIASNFTEDGKRPKTAIFTPHQFDKKWNLVRKDSWLNETLSAQDGKEIIQNTVGGPFITNSGVSLATNTASALEEVIGNIVSVGVNEAIDLIGGTSDYKLSPEEIEQIKIAATIIYPAYSAVKYLENEVNNSSKEKENKN